MVPVILQFNRYSLVLVALGLFVCPLASQATDPVLRIHSNAGTFFIQLFEQAAPGTVANFLDYANAGDYNDSIIHRSVPGFVIQGGGYLYDGGDTALVDVPRRAPIQNEFNQSNLRGTLAMAKVGGNPDSATSEWFVNLADNGANLDNQNGGFTVFGAVRGNGMEVIDSIAALPRFNFGSPFNELPLIDYMGGGSVPLREEFVLLETIEQFALINPISSALLPGARTIQNVSGTPVPATAFVTLVNSAQSTAASCFIEHDSQLPLTFTYQTTDPLTNEPTGSPNEPVDIAPGAGATFVVSFSATAAFETTDVTMRYGCGNADDTAILPGINTITLSASANASPDVVALAATPDGNGIVTAPPGGGGSGVFAVAMVNVGSAAQITASADTGDVALPLNVFLCPTDIAGACESPLQLSTQFALGEDSTATVGVFVQPSAAIELDPAQHRVFVRFTDEAGRNVGATSVAVQTQE